MPDKYNNAESTGMKISSFFACVINYRINFTTQKQNYSPKYSKDRRRPGRIRILHLSVYLK